jgi:hypothetical protein
MNAKYVDEYCENDSDFINIDDVAITNYENFLDDEKLD